MLEFARENGWPQTIARAVGSVQRRLRDRMTARKLRAPGFRAGRTPRLLGLAHMQVGKNFNAGDALWLEATTEYGGERFEPRLVIGDNVNVSDRVHIACLNAVTIGAGALIGSGTLISDHAHGVYRGEGQSSPEVLPGKRPLRSMGPVTIGRNVWLGDRVSVLPGAVIGDGAVIGAASVVVGEIPAASLAVGSPARVIRRWDPARNEWVNVDGGQ